MIRYAIIVGVLLASHAGAYWAGLDHGTAKGEAAKVPGLVETIQAGDRGAVALQDTIDFLDSAGSAVRAAVEAAITEADEADRRLADAGVMDDCPPFSERDVRLLNDAIDRIEAAAGVAGS